MAMKTSYGEFIRNRRKDLHISQHNLSEALECTPQAVSKYENDKSTIYLGMLGKLSRLLQVDITSLLHGVAEKNNDLADRMDFDRKAFQQRLLFLREKRNLTQKAFSSQIGIPVFKITKWETGKSLPSLEEFMRLAEFYSLPYEELYFGQGLETKELPAVKEETPSTEKRKQTMRRILPWVFVGFAIAIFIILIVVLSLLFAPSSETNASSSSTSSSSEPSSTTSSNVVSSSSPSSSAQTDSGRPPVIISVDISAE